MDFEFLDSTNDYIDAIGPLAPPLSSPITSKERKSRNRVKTEQPSLLNSTVLKNAIDTLSNCDRPPDESDSLGSMVTTKARSLSGNSSAFQNFQAAILHVIIRHGNVAPPNDNELVHDQLSNDPLIPNSFNEDTVILSLDSY